MNHRDDLISNRDEFFGKINKWENITSVVVPHAHRESVNRLRENLGHIEYWVKVLYDQCIFIVDTKATVDAVNAKADRSAHDSLRAAHDSLAHQFGEAKVQLSEQLGALDQHLKHGIPDELHQLCETQIKAIGELCDGRLATMKGLNDSVSGHAGSAQQAGRVCLGIQQALGELDQGLREFAQRSETTLAGQLTAAQQSAQQCSTVRADLTKTCEQVTRELTELKVAAETAAQTAHAKAAVAVTKQSEVEAHAQQMQEELARLRTEAAAVRENLKEARGTLDAMQIAAAHAKGSQTVAEASAHQADESARQATTTMTACATFWGRLRWLLLGHV